MSDKYHNIFNICNGCSFWDTLAGIYLDKYKNFEYKLASILFLVPNRRSCNVLTNAFVRKQGLKPVILPQIVPITEIDDDELFFDKFDIANIGYDNSLSPINKEERLFIFTKLIMSKPQDFGLKQISLVQALNLSRELANLIDTACNQGLSFDKLQTLVPEKYATHWQETLKLLKIITEFWPLILKERNAIDVCELKKQQLFCQAEVWKKQHTDKVIVAAGITASFPSIVELLNTVKDIPNGEIYFAGINRFADSDYWDNVDETNPQFELKELLELLNLDRHKINDIYVEKNSEREKLISEIMRPALISDKWRCLNNKINVCEALSGINILECKTQRDEALAIALKMREILNIPEKTATLVTYDRNLARRVVAELSRFNISIDDSAGLPLNLSPIGIFLRLIVEACENLDSNMDIISLMKNPFMLMGESPSEFRKKVYNYELCLRKNGKVEQSEENKNFIDKIKNTLNDFSELLHKENIRFYDVFLNHIKLAELLSSSNEQDGAKILWRGDAGKCAAKFAAKILETADVLGNINGNDYLLLISELMSMESVRSNYGTHPRLSILGPIEARLCYFDYVILGEFNDGFWPKQTQADMWMSRPMKKDFGFSLPEKNVGILASDLCNFLGNDNVIITRAERVDGVPMKKSRWLLRLETVLNALNYDVHDILSSDFVSFVNKIDIPSVIKTISSPAPCPPVEARPRKLSASALDLLISDPYSVFAKYILRLFLLDDLDIPLDQRDYGTLIHKIIEEFNNLYPNDLPNNAYDILIDLGKKHFSLYNIDKELEVFWFPKFEKTAKWIINQEQNYRFNVYKVNNEIEGEIVYSMPRGDFKFTAKADRIDKLKNGCINIIDYKTGQIPTKNQVKSGFALQVVLEALIASKGGFNKIDTKNIENLIYWQLGNKSLEINASEGDIINKTEDYILRLISAFDFETTPYLSRPTPKYISKNRDYEHLARIREWSVQDNEDSSDE